MKTTVKEVIVEVKEGSQVRRHTFPIVSKDGDLMTHRLKRLMDGKLSTRHSNGPDSEQHFIGMVWRPPYTLLHELHEENQALKGKLVHLDGCDNLVVAESPRIPRRVPYDTITQMVRDELKLYYSLRRRIKARSGEP